MNYGDEINELWLVLPSKCCYSSSSYVSSGLIEYCIREIRQRVWMESDFLEDSMFPTSISANVLNIFKKINYSARFHKRTFNFVNMLFPTLGRGNIQNSYWLCSC